MHNNKERKSGSRTNEKEEGRVWGCRNGITFRLYGEPVRLFLYEFEQYGSKYQKDLSLF